MNEKIYLPLVSIIIPVYNGSDYMREAIDSALAQTYENIEIIVVNDGSTDNTDDIALSYGEKIRYFRKENGGVSSALNLGIKKMHGEYFSWLSHDDSYYPEKISVQMQALKNVENTKTLLICDSEFMDKDSKTLNKKSRCLVSANENTLIPWNQALHILLDQGSFNGCSFLIPKSAFDECGLFDESLRFNQDSYMWTNLFLAGYSLYYVPQVCVRNRIHNNQVTQKRQDLFHKDCEAVSGVLIPRLMQITNKNDRFLFEYAKYNAKYNNKKIVKNVSQSADKNHFNTVERLIVLIFLMYGKIRPALRKVYYLLKIKA